jgi:ATP-binding cassette subfamily F protein 3
VLLITHDPHLVELVADRLWLVADGTVRDFDGDLDEYRALLAERARAGSRDEAAPAGGAKAAERRDRVQARAQLAPLRQRLKEVEKLLERLGLEAKLIEKRLADPDTYAKRSSEDIAWATTRAAAIAKEVAALEEEWLDLSEKLDAA